MARNEPQAFVEVDATLGGVGQSGLAGEMLVAVVNHQYDVHLLFPASPAPAVLVISDPRQLADVLVVEFLTAPNLSPAARHHLGSSAGAALGLAVHDVYVVP